MPLRTEHIINVTLDDSPTSITGQHDFRGRIPKRTTLLVQMVESGSGASVAITVEVSPDGGASLITYDKLIVDAGVDAPVASVNFTATADDIISFSPEDVFNYIKVTATGTSTTSSNKYAVDVWLVYEF